MRAQRSDLHALARKYRALSDLRRGLLVGESTVLRALANEFPGALRELDCLPLDALDERLNAVSAAAEGHPAAPWMDWMLSYHRRMRLALAAKRRLAELRDGNADPVLSVVLYLWEEHQERWDPELIRRIARPPGGRLNPLVFELLEAELGRSRTELEATLFPRLGRRRS